MSTLSRIIKKVSTLPERRRRERMLANLPEPNHASLVRLGSRFGGWIIPEAVLIPGVTAVCVGAGEDISFDVELNKRGMRVFTVDPTPRAARHVRRVLEGAVRGETVPINNSQAEHYDLSGFEANRLKFLEVGLSDTNPVLRFWTPKDPTHVSHSIVNLQKTGEFFEAQCIRLQDLCAANGIDEIEILKIDVEGAEYSVLKDLTAGPIRPRVVCVEFDEGPNLEDRESSQRIAGAVRETKQAGYRLLKTDRWNFLFSFEKA